MAKYLIEWGADVNLFDTGGDTPLIKTIQTLEHLGLVSSMIDELGIVETIDNKKAVDVYNLWSGNLLHGMKAGDNLADKTALHPFGRIKYTVKNIKHVCGDHHRLFHSNEFGGSKSK